MSRQVRVEVFIEVPDNHGPVLEEDVLSLCSLAHADQLNPPFKVQVVGADFDTRLIHPHRRHWQEKIYKHLFRNSPRRFTSRELADVLSIPGIQQEEAKALGETLQRMASRGIIRRERQAGAKMWSYYR